MRCFSQDGEEHRDYDLSILSMAAGLREALVVAFVKRVAPGAGLTSLHSTDHAYRVLVKFDRYLATLQWPPREAEHLAPEHFDGFHNSRKHTGSGPDDLRELRLLLDEVEGLTDAMAGRIGAALPRRQREDGSKESYSRAEFKRIADAARSDLRAAARRIRDSRELLRQFREGEQEAGNDRQLALRLQLLDWVDRFADVPRNVRASGITAGRSVPQPWITKEFGSVKQVMSWLHLTIDEVAAGAVLLAVMTGENPEVIHRTPSVHHRADGHTGALGTAIVDLRKPRRGRRAYMNLALSDVPNWISIPEKPEEVSARDELHTPFGLYVLLHELTARSRAMVGGKRLLVGYASSGGGAMGNAGRGLRQMSSGLPVTRLSRAWLLPSDKVDEEKGEPVPLVVRLDLLRLTYIELNQKPVAHTEKTAVTQYMLRNRGNVAEYRQVVAQTLTAEVDKARTRGTVNVMTSQEVERARLEPEAVAAELGLDPVTLKRMIAGELDTVLTACADNKNSPHAPPGQPCPASFMLCLGCECARAMPRHIPVQVLVHDRLLQRREEMDALRWAERFAGPHAQLADLLDQHDEAAVADARRDATAADHALADRFLNRELDLR
ncbi:hypothetical protein BIV25_45035 [Streptomyces sp. MUSC 14]|uniref:hypothetical protein n=1 Tax=Streptomyces sp. MUSC 14 TaxID=1354889 RepID=UPI0008F584D9|nr:hypothetical protein [Streptomyces sp. MUSC 14]OIJ85078.1 hypothetical protein BIV25_45035 [Streptomyces sp. MUSC 14]